MRYNEILCESTPSSFRLHPGLDPAKYQITDSLSDIERWRAYTYDGQGKVKAGDMAGVGYVMISLVDNTIVPISRGDEHNSGYDSLRDSIAKAAKKSGHALNPRDYLPIWANGNNYIYDESEIPDLLIALRKYLSWGGKNGLLRGMNDLRKMAVSLKQFVENEGRFTIAPGQLAPVGTEIVSGFVKLAAALEKARVEGAPKSARNAAFREALALHTLIWRYVLLVAIKDVSAMKELPKAIRRAQREDDLGFVETTFFGFDGIKNQMHNAIREVLAKRKAGERYVWKEDDLVAAWGDLDLAFDRLGRF